MKKIQGLFCVLLCLSMRVTYTMNIGSDTAVNRFNTQQTLSNGDRIAGFAGLDGGFALANYEVSGIFDSFFHVAGPIALNRGELVLNQDLLLVNITSITSLGSVIGNNHVLSLAQSVQSLSNGVVAIDGDITFLTLAANPSTVFSVSWNNTGEYVAVGIASGAGNELQIFSWNGTSLSLITGAELGPNVLSVQWHPINNWLAVGRASGAGAEIYNYSFNGTSLTLLDSIDLGGGTGNNVGSVSWRPQGDFLAVGCDTNAGELRIYPVNGSGIFGTVLIED